MELGYVACFFSGGIGALMQSELNINGQSGIILKLLFWNDSFSFYLLVSTLSERTILLKTANFPLTHATSKNEAQYIIDQNVRGMQLKVVLISYR